MTFNSNLQTTEPAFLSHEKYVRQSPSGLQKRLTDCCFSLSNLALIVSCILALLFSVKFLNDDPLYEYGEYLLGLKFYRYIVFIIVILPLALLVPLTNAVSAFFLSGSNKRDLGSSVIGVKLFYQIVMVILIFVGLIFIAPSIRHSSVANLIDTEFKRHMKWRYDSEFSYELLDRLQSEYECCDELWYRSNYFDRLPLSCYHTDGTYSRIHSRNCGDTLGSLVSNRCIIIAINLMIIILSLASLIGIDAVELTSLCSSKHYDIRDRETSLMKSKRGELETTSLSSRRNSRDDDLDLFEERNELVEELTNRLMLRERERETPLLPKTTSPTRNRPSPSAAAVEEEDEEDDEDFRGGSTSVAPTATTLQPTGPILTRANYLNQYYNRPKSPVFIRTPDGGSIDEAGPSYTNSSTQGSHSPKGVLKKTSSFQKIDSESDCEDVLDQKPVQRDAQTRRSLLNVRFAD